MIQPAILIMLLVQAQQTFTNFTYCRETAGHSFDSLCIQLDPKGVGDARLKRQGEDDMVRGVTLSPGGRDQFLSVLSGTKYLANSKSYESKRKVADLGKKHMILQIGAERREAEFNYSEMKDVTALVNFFEGLLTQEILAIDLEWALKFDTLGIPDRLDQIDRLIKDTRIVDPKNLTDVLDMIDKDDRVVNYARAHARELKEKLALVK